MFSNYYRSSVFSVSVVTNGLFFISRKDKVSCLSPRSAKDVPQDYLLFYRVKTVLQTPADTVVPVSTVIPVWPVIPAYL